MICIMRKMCSFYVKLLRIIEKFQIMYERLQRQENQFGLQAKQLRSGWKVQSDFSLTY